MKNCMILLFIVLLDIIMAIANGENCAYCQNSSTIEIKMTLDKKYYEAGEPIKLTYEFINISQSSVWLPPLQIVDINFTMYRDDSEILPFSSPNMPFYGFNEHGFIELLPGQSHIFKRILDKNIYKIPSDAGEYRLCINYENNKKSMRNIDFWVGKISSCVPLKIE